jgi:hypothetical protein
MRFSFLTVMAVLTPAAAFAPHSSLSRAFVTGPSSVSRTELNMAFQGTQQTSNMFEGPGPLVRERDACGVGFIANTKSGGTLIELLLFCLLCSVPNSVAMEHSHGFIFHSNYFQFHSPSWIRPQLSIIDNRRVWYTQGPSRRNRCTHLHGAPWCLRR